MDISYNCENQKFNYRVCAMIIAENKILAMHDERSPYFYLPGGRVKMGETAEQAVVREVQEELGVTPEITRPLCSIRLFLPKMWIIYIIMNCVFIFWWIFQRQLYWKEETSLL